MNEARQTVSLTDSVEESWLNLKKRLLEQQRKYVVGQRKGPLGSKLGGGIMT